MMAFFNFTVSLSLNACSFRFLFSFLRNTVASLEMPQASMWRKDTHKQIPDVDSTGVAYTAMWFCDGSPTDESIAKAQERNCQTLGVWVEVFSSVHSQLNSWTKIWLRMYRMYLILDRLRTVSVKFSYIVCSTCSRQWACECFDIHVSYSRCH